MLKHDTPSPAFCAAILAAFEHCEDSQQTTTTSHIWSAMLQAAQETGDLGARLTELFDWDTSVSAKRADMRNRLIDIFHCVDRGYIPELEAFIDATGMLIARRETA